MSDIKIGDLRQRITFQKATEVDDGHGGKDITGWTDVVTVWAQIEPISGREYFFAAQIKAEITHRARIRYRSGLDEEMRIKFGTRILTIESIRDLKELHKFMEILCREEKEQAE